MIDRSMDSGDANSDLIGGVLGADFDSPDGLNNTLAKGQIVDELGDGNSSSSPLSLESSTAVGDSGGPAFVRTSNQWRIHGVVSYGTNESKYGDITVFTRLASHLDWIRERIPNWPSSRFVGDGNWRQNIWFDFFYPFSNNWCYHLNIGWIYVQDSKSDIFWAWNELLEKWTWIHAYAYPWVYAWKAANNQQWIYIDLNNSSPQKLYAYDETNGWANYENQ